MKLKKALVVCMLLGLTAGVFAACDGDRETANGGDYYLLSGTMNDWLSGEKESSYVLSESDDGKYELQNVKLVKNTQFVLLKNGKEGDEELTYSYFDETSSTPDVIANGKGESSLEHFFVKEDGYYSITVDESSSVPSVIVEKEKDDDTLYTFDHAASGDGIDFTREEEGVIKFVDDGSNIHQFAVFDRVEGTKWYAEATFVYKGRTETFKGDNDGRAGIVSMRSDRAEKVAYTLIYDKDKICKDLKISQWNNNDWGKDDKNRWIQDRNYSREATIGLLRQDEKYYMFYNGAFVELDGVYAYDASGSIGAEEASVPAIYAAKSVVAVKDVFATSNCDTCPVYQEKVRMINGEALSDNENFTQYGNAEISQNGVAFHDGSLGGKLYQNYAEYNKTLKGDFTIEFDVKDMNFFTSGGWMWSKLGISLSNASGEIDRLTVCVHESDVRRFQVNLGAQNVSYKTHREGTWGDYATFGSDWDYKGEHKVKFERRDGIYYLYMDGQEYVSTSDSTKFTDGRAKSSFADDEELTLTFDTEFAKGSISNIKITSGE